MTADRVGGYVFALAVIVVGCELNLRALLYIGPTMTAILVFMMMTPSPFVQATWS